VHVAYVIILITAFSYAAFVLGMWVGALAARPRKQE
jgi:hypothetical protein